VDVLVGDVDRRVTGDGLGAGQHLEQHQPGGVDVAAGISDAPLHLFGGEVGDGAEQDTGRARDGLAGHGPGQTEVGDLDRAVVVDDDVLGLDVTVDQAVGVGLAEGEQHRFEDVERGARGEGPLLAHHLTQGQARNVLHDEEHDVTVATLVVHGDDVGVRQGCRRARLAVEAGDEALVVDEVLTHDLQRHLATEALVEGQVDGGHSAVGESTEHSIAPVEGAPDERVAVG
jgi:hypothetical protein